MIYRIDPCAKPRMTRKDKWCKRPIVQKYWEFKAKCKELGIKVNNSGDKIVFLIPMPKSWSKKKKLEMLHKPHQNKPDNDNLMKGLLDAVHHHDQDVWNYEVTKIWSDQGGIKIKHKKTRAETREKGVIF